MSFRVGSRVIIVDTANVLARCPELVGSVGAEPRPWTHHASFAPGAPWATRARPFENASSNPRVNAGEVTKVPEPPSKWYDVLVTDGRTIQFQASALHAATSSRAATAAQYREGDGEESEEEVQADKQSHAQSLKRGTQVAIHRTENVQQRAPHLIGRIGTIKEVPQHPNTWFKVQFADRRVCTFRPSALRRVASGAQRSRKGSDDDEPAQKPRGRGARLLSSVLTGRAVDAERWVGTHVRVRVGRLGGQVGRILRSGNGWVQLRTARGEIAKRAYELELVDEKDAERANDDIEESSKRTESATAARQAAAAKRKEQQAKAERAATRGASKDDDEEEEPKRKPNPRKPPPPPPPPPTTRGATAAVGGANRQPQLLARVARGVSSSAKQAAYREGVRKHVERARDRYRDRPHLAEWLEALQGGPWDANESNGVAYRDAYLSGSDDSDDEAPLMGPRWCRRAARRDRSQRLALGPPGCVLCRVAKDPHGACWNSACPASPVFCAPSKVEVKKKPASKKRKKAAVEEEVPVVQNTVSRLPKPSPFECGRDTTIPPIKLARKREEARTAEDCAGPEPEEDSLPPGPGKRAEAKAKAAQEAQAAVDAAEKAAAEKEAAKKAAEAPPPAPAPAEEAPAAEAPAPAPAPVKEDVEMTDAPPAAAA